MAFARGYGFRCFGAGVFAVLACLCACIAPDENPSALFDRATTDLRQGRPSEALVITERGLASIQDRNSLWHWKLQLLRCEILIGLARAKETLLVLRQTLPQAPEFTALRARQAMLYARVIQYGQELPPAQRLQEAGRALETARGLAQQSSATDVLLAVDLLEGPRLVMLGRSQEAEQLLIETARRAVEWKDSRAESGAWLNRGMIRLRRERFDEAAGFFERSLALSRKDLDDLYSVALINYAICRSRLGQYEESIRTLEESIKLLEQAGATHYLQLALGELGNTRILQLAPKEAVPPLTRALDIAKKLGRSADAARWATNLALANADIEDWASAERFNRESEELKRRIGAKTLVYNTLNEGHIALGRGDLDGAAQAFETALKEAPDNPGVQWNGHAGLARVSRVRGDRQAAKQYYERAIELVEQRHADLTRTDFRLSFLGGLILFYRGYVDFLLEQNLEAEALSIADSSRARVLAERFGSGQTRRLPASDYQRSARAAGAVFLSYWITPRQSRLWVVTPKNIRGFALPAEKELASLIQTYRTAIRNQSDPARTRLAAGERLYDLLVKPALSENPSANRIVVIPDGPLHQLNLETLPVPGGNGRYWIEEAEVTVAPSLAVLAGPSPRGAAQPRSLLLLGAPASADAEFPPLAYADQEVAFVESQFTPASRTVYRGPGATPEAFLKGQAGKASHIHFAAHAQANHESPLDSAVILSPGNGRYKLYARDLLDVPLHAQLVTVSACRGAGTRAYSGEGLVGFAWAFLRAGARRVIAGLWDVDDQSTAQLMEGLYRGIASGLLPEAALRQAKLSLLRSEGNFRKPYYWGPFQLYRAGP